MTITASVNAVYSSLTTQSAEALARFTPIGTVNSSSWPEISMIFPNRRGQEAMAIIPPNRRTERCLYAALLFVLVCLPALAAFAFATASWAEDARKGAVPKEVQAKL